jgi:SAM-dependent methyltransferase
MADEVIGVVPIQPEYYSSSYWNSYEDGIREINRRISGDPELPWYAHFHRSVSQRRFRRALFLLCGNGWLERRILDECPFFEEGVGVDHSSALLAEARAASAGLPLTYHQMDVNTAAFPEEEFDLVINLAACHHVAYLDRVLRRLSGMLPADGYLVGFDYVGPHRNQYPYEHWNAAWMLNRSLPEHLRQDMNRRYPHLRTMLHTDPTEAIHSELILEVTARYFRFEEHRHAGGALAYPLMHDNEGLRGLQELEQQRWVRFLMEADGKFLAENPGSSYFDYYACRPRKEVLRDTMALERYEAEEARREAEARGRGGVYDEPTLLQTLYAELADQSLAAEHRLAVVQQLQGSRAFRLRRWLGRAAGAGPAAARALAARVRPNRR